MNDSKSHDVSDSQFSSLVNQKSTLALVSASHWGNALSLIIEIIRLNVTVLGKK